MQRADSLRSWCDEAVRRIDADFARSADTHLLRVDIPGNPGCPLYLKDESVHPTGSLKHRLARSLFLYGLCNGLIGPRTTVVEASSGSTAVSEAYLARLIGVPFVAVMPRLTSPEKIAVIEFHGGRCHLVDSPSAVYAEAAALARSARLGEGNRRQLLVIVRTALTLFLCLALAACNSNPINRKDGTTSERPMSLSGIAKGDIDDVTELAQREAIAGLKRLTEKLYRRNPAELQKNSAASMEAAIANIFGPLNHWHLSPRRQLDWQASINNAFNETFAGDRIDALMTGLLTMVMAYDHKTETYVLDSLDPQKLYNDDAAADPPDRGAGDLSSPLFPASGDAEQGDDEVRRLRQF